MKYCKMISNGYIIAISYECGDETDGNISEAEYNQIDAVIQTRPAAPEGYAYRLREDLTWELVAAPPPVEEPPEQTPEERIAELEEALEMILTGVTEDE